MGDYDQTEEFNQEVAAAQLEIEKNKLNSTKEEITIDMALMGVTRVDQIAADYVCKAQPVTFAHEMSAFCHMPGGRLV